MNDDRPTHVDLFSGIGGFSLAFEAEGFRTIAFAETDPYASAVLREHWPGVPNLGDIRKLCRRDCEPRDEIEWLRPDVVTGGVPCQPSSALGQMRGTADERWLWPEAIRIVRELRPPFAIFENTPSLLVLESGRAWNGIVSGLVALGYDCWWDVLPAAAVGAGHLRKRVILVAAHTGGTGLQGHARHGPRSGEAGECGADARRPIATPDLRGRVRDFGNGKPWWHEANTGVPVLAHGLSSKLAEAASRCAGNAIVPQVAQVFARAIYQQLRPMKGAQ